MVKFPRNIEAFKKSDIMIFINKSVEDIISDIEIGSRPLLKDGKEKLYNLYMKEFLCIRNIVIMK